MLDRLVGEWLYILRDKSSARSNFMPWSWKSFTANKQSLYRNIIFALIEHESQINSVATTRRFRHVPSVISACKFQLLGNLHCDNRTVYKCVWTSNYCGTKTDGLISFSFCLKPQ